MWVGGQRHALVALPLEKRPGAHCKGGWVATRAGLDGCGRSRPHRDSISDRPDRSKSLYRLRCPGRQWLILQLFEIRKLLSQQHFARQKKSRIIFVALQEVVIR
jgi:hypothetical protein